MKIIVLAGGTSTERDVSIVSGTKVCEALRSKGHQAVLLDVFCGNEQLDIEHMFETSYDLDADVAYIKSFNDKIAAMQEERREFFGPNVLEACKAADVVFLALHGACGEDGRIQAAFDLLGIVYTGSGYLGSALAMDKGITKQLMRENGVPTAYGVIIKKDEPRKTADELGVGLPCVVKTACGGSSVGVYIVETEEAYEKAVEDGFGYEDKLVVEQYVKGREFSIGVVDGEAYPVVYIVETEEAYEKAVEDGFGYEDKLVVEQYVKGREFSIGVVDGEAYPVIEIAPLVGFYDYKNKYEPGSTIETCPAVLSEDLTKEMQKYAVEAYYVLRLENYARIDFMMNEQNEMFMLEANTLPGMTPTSLLPQEAAVLGYSFADLCENLIHVSLKNAKRVMG